MQGSSQCLYAIAYHLESRRVHRRRRTRHTPRQVTNAVARGSRGSERRPDGGATMELRRACDSAGSNRVRSELGPNSAVSAALDK